MTSIPSLFDLIFSFLKSQRNVTSCVTDPRLRHWAEAAHSLLCSHRAGGPLSSWTVRVTPWAVFWGLTLPTQNEPGSENSDSWQGINSRSNSAEDRRMNWDEAGKPREERKWALSFGVGLPSRLEGALSAVKKKKKERNENEKLMREEES